MTILRRMLASVLLAGCLAGAAFVVFDTLTRSDQPGDASTESVTTSTPPTTNGAVVDRFNIANTKNAFVPLVQLPPTATTQPKTP